MKSCHPFDDAAVEAAYRAFPAAVREQLLELRDLVFETNARTPGAGPISEALKWGQPSFVTEGRHGSTFRLGVTSDAGATHALFFLCQTSLVGTFRELYGDRLRFSGNRAILFDGYTAYPREAISHCMALAMTYHLKRSN